MAFGEGDAVESIFVELGLDPQKFFTGVDSAVDQGARKAEQFGQRSSAVMSKIAAAAAIAGAAVLGIFSVRTIKGAISYTEEYAAEIRKLARETGMTVERSAEMLAAFHEVNLDGAAASASLGILAKKLKGVQDEETGLTTGSKSTAAILADLGIQVLDLEGNLRPMGDLIPEIADVFKSMPDGIEKTGLAMQLFGRSGKDMIPLLNMGSEGMAEAAAQANKLGLVLSGDNIEKIKQYTLAQRTFGEAVGGLKLVIGVALIPILTKGLNLLISWQPAIRQGLGKAVQWLTTVFGALWKYLKYVVTTGDTLNEYLTEAGTPLSVLFLLLGETIVKLKSIAEWLLTAADAVLEWGRKLGDLLSTGQSTADNFDKLGFIIPIVADAIVLLVAAMVVSTVVSFALAIGRVAVQFVTFPIREALVAVGAVKDFVLAVAGMVSKAVTITQNVVQSGAEIIRSLPWVYGEVKQMVIRTGDKIIDKLGDVTGTVTVGTPKVDTDETKSWLANVFGNMLGGIGGSPEVVKGIGLFVGGVLAGIGAAIGSGISITGLTATFGAAFSTAFAGVAGVLAAIPVAGWIALAVIVVVLIVAALAIVFREKLAAFFTGPFPRFFTDALPALAASLPGWAGQLAGMIAAALVFAFIGIPILIIQKLIEGLKAGAPAIAGAIGGALKGLGGAILATVAGIPWGKIAGAIGKGLADAGGAIRDFAKSVPGWIATAVQEIPGLFWNALKAIPGLLADAGGAIQRFARSIPGWIEEGLRSIPGLVAAIPGWFADALGAIPGLARAALTGAGGLVAVVAGALADVLRTIVSTPVGEAVGALMGELLSGFQTGWNRVNEATGGAVNDIVTAIAGLPGLLVGFVGNLFGAAADLGGAIFDGLMAGLKAVPEALGDLTGAIAGVFKTAINAGLQAINDAIPNKIGKWGVEINLPDNPIPLLDFHQGGIVPGAIGAPVMALVHGGEEITPAGQAAPVFNFNMPLTISGVDFAALRRAAHLELDGALSEAARRAYLGGAPLTGGIG